MTAEEAVRNSLAGVVPGIGWRASPADKARAFLALLDGFGFEVRPKAPEGEPAAARAPEGAAARYPLDAIGRAHG